jgi:ABC-type Zn uptake system ZnuABC Zn-binding protein ZnuA
MAVSVVRFENGLAFESWLDDLYTATASQAKRIAVSDGIETLTFASHAHDHDAASEAADHEQEAVTPHRLAVADGDAALYLSEGRTIAPPPAVLSARR